MASSISPRAQAPQPAKPSTCRVCRMDVPVHAARCGHCRAWLAEPELSNVNRAIVGLGYTWAALSVMAAIGALFGGGIGWSRAMQYIIALVIAVQGLLLGLGAVSFAERG